MPGFWRDWPFVFLFPGVVWFSWTFLKRIPRMRKFSVIAEGTYDHSNHRCLRPLASSSRKGICFRTIHLKEDTEKYYFVRDICELSAKPGTRIRILGNGREYKIEFPEEVKDPA